MDKDNNERKFTAPQQAAINSTGIRLVVAGPGTGKTAVVVEYIANKLTAEAGPRFDPTQIVAATFGRKARMEIRARLAERVDQAQAGRVSVVTLHAMCKGVIEPYREWLGFDQAKPMSIVLSGERVSLLKRAREMVRRQLAGELEQPAGATVANATRNGHAQRAGDAKTHTHAHVQNGMTASGAQIMAKSHAVGEGRANVIQACGERLQLLAQMTDEMLSLEVARYKAAGLLPDQAAPIGPRADVVTAVYQVFQRMLMERNKVEFDDLQLYAHKLLDENAEAREYFQTTWPVVVLDEAQDISEQQYQIIRLLLGERSHALVVGDAHQCIYGFRGALGGDVFNRMQADFARASVMVLPDNHRNAESILRTSEALMGLEQKRQVAVRQGGVVSLVRSGSGHEEAAFIAQQIQQITSSGFALPGEIAVLARTNDMVAHIERAMMDAKVPYTIAGSGNFFEHGEVAQVMAYLRLTQGADTHAMRQVINVPDRGLPKAAVDQLRGEAEELTLEHLFDDERVATLEPAAQQGIEQFRRVLEALHELRGVAPEVAIGFVMKELGMRAYLERHDDKTRASRLERVRVLAHMAAEHGNIPAFIEDVELMSGEDPLAPGADERVQLMSLHRAKGLEFKVVFLAGVEEDLLPLSGAKQTRAGIAEERRLLYVGVTRAAQALVMSYAATRGQARALPSSFLSTLGGVRNLITRQVPAWGELQCA